MCVFTFVTKISCVCRTGAASGGVVALNVWLRVVVEMFRAVGTCKGTFQDDSTAGRHWDMAVALYTGSFEGTTGDGDGKLLHQLTDDMCLAFRTCGSGSDGNFGRAFANRQILKSFREGKTAIGNCGRLEALAQNVEIFMKISLVQATLKFAYQRSNGATNEIDKGAGAAFASAILPHVYDCNPQDAAAIYRNMDVGSTSVDFAEVKQALERQYQCLGITCQSIGGLFANSLNTYYIGAEPCADNRSLDSIGVASITPAPTPVLHDRATYGPAAAPGGASSSNSGGGGDDTAVIAGSVSAVVVVAIAAVALLCYMVKRNKESNPESKGNAPEFTPADTVKESAEMT